MRLVTIWTMPVMSTMERLRRTREWAFQGISAKLPVRIKYYVTLQQLAGVTTKLPQAAVPDITMEDILKNLDAPKGLD